MILRPFCHEASQGQRRQAKLGHIVRDQPPGIMLSEALMGPMSGWAR